MMAADTAPPAVTQLLDSLVQQAAASVRAPTAEEEADAREAGSRTEIELRLAAEALLAVGEAAGTAAFRAQHGELALPLLVELDKRLTNAMYSDSWGDNSMLWDKVKGRPSAKAIQVASSLGSSPLGRMGAMSLLLGMLGGAPPLDQLTNLRSNLLASANTQRPPLASPLSRFDKSYQPPAANSSGAGQAARGRGAGGRGKGRGGRGRGRGAAPAEPAAAAASVAVSEARCEVSCADMPWGGSITLGGDCLAVSSGSGWKKEQPYLGTWRLAGGEGAGEGSWQSRFATISTGLYEPGFCSFMDPARNLVWSYGSEGRIKGLTLDGGATGAAAGAAAQRSACRYTLAPSKGGKLVGVVGGRVLSALGGGGAVEYWDIARLTQQQRWISVDELRRRDEEDWARAEQEEEEAGKEAGKENEGQQAKRRRRESFGCKVLDLRCDMSEGFYRDSTVYGTAEVEVTAGEEPHGRLNLLGTRGSPGHHRIEHLRALGAAEADDAQSQQVVATMECSNSVWVFDWPTAQLTSLLTGHAGNVTGLSTCPSLPHNVATGSYDGTVYVWDLRSGGSTHMLTTRSEKGVRGLALVEDQGVPFCFSTQAGDEAVLCWDLRMRRCLYELATGNTDVHDLQWHAPSRSLFATGESGTNPSGCMGSYHWPKAMHSPSDFPHVWNATGHVLIRYQFKEAPDPAVRPPEAQRCNCRCNCGGSGSDDDDNGEGGEEWEGDEEEEGPWGGFGLPYF